MQRTFIIAILFFFVLIAGCEHKPIETRVIHVEPATQPADQEIASDYRLQEGDALEIKFFYHPELNQEVAVGPDGKVSLQLIDEVMFAGHTIPEVRKTLTEKYSGEIREPNVSVILKAASTRKIYVGGEVKTQSIITYDGTITALQAIFQAGGITPTSNTENVVILRNQGTQTPVYILVDLRSDLEKPGQRHDIRLLPQDIVYVPKSTIGKMDDFVDQYIDKVLPFSRSVGLFYDIGNRSNP